jgi:2-polyprenyl-6-methoxyphenol hydroxylase-like FAD-dependent oxidoreductase
MHHGEHAVVIGASMGGLVAAAAVAPHYARVTVLDRDRLPASPANRRGVPQGRHAHGFQAGGLLALDQLLPGIREELAAAGAPAGDTSADCSWFVGGNRFARGDAGAPAVGLTRPFLEHRVRARVAALPHVTIRDGAEVAGLLPGPGRAGRHRVIGVRLDGGEPVAADLVVDASGRVSRLPDWLAELGYPAPAEERVHCRMAYLTRRWRLPEGALGSDVVTVVTTAEKPQFGVAIAQEDGSHIVTVGGLLDGAPQRSDEAYRAFALGLPDPRIGAALDGAEPVTDFQPARFPYSRRRRYDRLRAFPDGLLALGDSIASFNPMYGQGMSVAALEAVELHAQLSRDRLDARGFFKQAHRIEDVAWKISTGGDLRYPEVEGRRTPDMKLMNGYLDRLTLAAERDPVLAVQFLRVAGFVERPQSLFRPAIVRRVLRGSRGARRTRVQVERELVTAAR